jgi:hypothetical protein
VTTVALRLFRSRTRHSRRARAAHDARRRRRRTRRGNESRSIDAPRCRQREARQRDDVRALSPAMMTRLLRAERLRDGQTAPHTMRRG